MNGVKFPDPSTHGKISYDDASLAIRDAAIESATVRRSAPFFGIA